MPQYCVLKLLKGRGAGTAGLTDGGKYEVSILQRDLELSLHLKICSEMFRLRKSLAQWSNSQHWTEINPVTMEKLIETTNVYIIKAEAGPMKYLYFIVLSGSEIFGLGLPVRPHARPSVRLSIHPSVRPSV